VTTIEREDLGDQGDLRRCLAFTRRLCCMCRGMSLAVRVAKDVFKPYERRFSDIEDLKVGRVWSCVCA
jgi:hypothetical protein